MTTPDDAPAPPGRAAARPDSRPPSRRPSRDAGAAAHANGPTAAVRTAAGDPAAGGVAGGDPAGGDPAARTAAGALGGGDPGAGDPGGASLRPMRWWDLDAVVALEHDLFPEDAWSRALFWSELADAGHPEATRTYLVAQDPRDGRITGYAGLAAVAGTGDVQTIAVARDQWGTGLGARLLTALLRAATAAECHEVLLEVRVDNDRAQRLYRRFGFEPIGFRKGYYQPGNVDALVMRLTDPDQDPDPSPDPDNLGADPDAPDRDADRDPDPDAPDPGPGPGPEPEPGSPDPDTPRPAGHGPEGPGPGRTARPPSRPRPTPSEEPHG